MVGNLAGQNQFTILKPFERQFPILFLVLSSVNPKQTLSKGPIKIRHSLHSNLRRIY